MGTVDLGGAVKVGGVLGSVQRMSSLGLLPAEVYFMIGTEASAGRVDHDGDLWLEDTPETCHVANASAETIACQEDSL